MGHMRHHAVVVTSFVKEEVEACHRFAKGLDCTVSEISAGGINGFTSFCVFPDGSKEGWPESKAGDYQRNKLVEYIETFADEEDGSNCVSWVEVQFGDGNEDNKIIRCN